jgi:hypothetical protein
MNDEGNLAFGVWRRVHALGFWKLVFITTGLAQEKRKLYYSA